MSHTKVTLLLGSNVGNSKHNIEVALNKIAEHAGDLVAKTPMMFTEPVEFVSPNNFCNIAVIIKTQFSPVNLLNLLKSIEREMGRKEDTRSGGEYQDRIIDIDIVLYGGLQFCCEELVIPHQKHLHQRAFSQELLNVLKKH